MHPQHTATPSRLTATATRKLPRMALLCLAAVYILAGLFFRDPWKSDDIIGVATMLTALREGSLGWLLPQIGNYAYAQGGPLPTWAGAITIWLAGPIMGDFAAARLPNLIWFGIMASATWYGTYLLGRRPEAQPLALPFGGEPKARDYGRMLADTALLLVLATVGILLRVHESSSMPAMLACLALAYYGMARMLDKPLSGAATLGLALAGALLTRGLPGALPILLAMLILLLPAPRHVSLPRQWLVAALALAALLFLAWYMPARAANPYWVDQWLGWNLGQFGAPKATVILRTLRDLSWFLWPTWPLALLALWRWRQWTAAPHIRLPASLAAGAVLCLLAMGEPFEPEFAMLVLPFAVLAAFALPTLRRGVVNTLDWFAIMCFSLTVASVWLGWVALHFGWPTKIAGNIARQTTGFEPHINLLATLLALVTTGLWAALVSWRLRTQPTALWRGTILSACGLTATWVLLALLWLPAIDYARSYRATSEELSQAIAANIRPGECVRSAGLGLAQRAAFRVFSNLNFDFSGNCNLVLLQTTNRRLESAGLPSLAREGQILWRGGRTADRHEVFFLVRRAAP
ncbi:glycosyltransferase [Bordetella sp. J329]|nr:glycosyltransferase [Bordetella sp. J329]